jgi:hypothetical protein
VGSSIKLDDQLPFVAVEVCDVSANCYLAPELAAHQLAIPQQLPECRLGLGLLGSQLTDPLALFFRGKRRAKTVEGTRKSHCRMLSDSPSPGRV